jgi:hypothetical protein
MYCSKCFSSNIVIKEKENYSFIECDDCCYEIFMSDEDLIDFISENFKLDKVEKEGREAFLSGKKIEDNPYCIFTGREDREFLQSKWVEGWYSEEENMLKTSEENRINKIIEAKDKEINDLTKRYINVLMIIKWFIQIYREVNSKKYLFGFSYKRLLNKLLKDDDKTLDELLDNIKILDQMIIEAKKTTIDNFGDKPFTD